jgi:hypothetical protein
MKFRLFVFFLTIFSVLIGAQPETTVSAQPDMLSLTSISTYTFGQAIRFRLLGETAVSIQSVTLKYQSSEMSAPIVVEKTVSSTTALDLEHVHKLAEIPLLPFTTVHYWWELLLESGERATVPENSFVYEDSQFIWQSLVKGDIAVHWTDSDLLLGELALEIVTESQAQLQSIFPGTIQQPIRLYIYPSSADLRTMLRLANYPINGTHADPGLGVLLVTAVNNRTAATDLRKSIPHELVHHRLNQLAGEKYATLPTWFNEGLATLVEQGQNPNETTVLKTAVENQSTFSLNQLCNAFPIAGRENMLAVAQSVSLLHHLQSQYGQQALRQLTAEYVAGVGCETAVVQTSGQPIAHFEQDWLITQQNQSPATQFWIENGLWFILILFGLLFMGLLVWRL